MTTTGDLTANFLSSHENLLLKAVYGPTMFPATQPRDFLITDTLDYCQMTCAASVSALTCLERTNLFHPARTKGNLSQRAAFIRWEMVVLILSREPENYESHSKQGGTTVKLELSFAYTSLIFQ
jgi:hypothetical protein